MSVYPWEVPVMEVAVSVSVPPRDDSAESTVEEKSVVREVSVP